MPITLAHSPSARLDRQTPVRRPLPGPQPQPSASDGDFMALQAAYRASGGIESADNLSARLTQVGCEGYIELARRLVGGSLFSFMWHGGVWIPVFQYEPDTLAVRDAPRRVLGELRSAFDGWSIASWHVRRRADLGGRRPLDLLDTDLPAVLRAARADSAAAAG